MIIFTFLTLPLNFLINKMYGIIGFILDSDWLGYFYWEFMKESSLTAFCPEGW